MSGRSASYSSRRITELVVIEPHGVSPPANVQNGDHLLLSLPGLAVHMIVTEVANAGTTVASFVQANEFMPDLRVIVRIGLQPDQADAPTLQEFSLNRILEQFPGHELYRFVDNAYASAREILRRVRRSLGMAWDAVTFNSREFATWAERGGCTIAEHMVRVAGSAVATLARDTAMQATREVAKGTSSCAITVTRKVIETAVIKTSTEVTTKAGEVTVKQAVSKSAGKLAVSTVKQGKEVLSRSVEHGVKKVAAQATTKLTCKGAEVTAQQVCQKAEQTAVTKVTEKAGKVACSAAKRTVKKTAAHAVRKVTSKGAMSAASRGTQHATQKATEKTVVNTTKVMVKETSEEVVTKAAGEVAEEVIKEGSEKAITKAAAAAQSALLTGVIFEGGIFAVKWMIASKKLAAGEMTKPEYNHYVKRSASEGAGSVAGSTAGAAIGTLAHTSRHWNISG